VLTLPTIVTKEASTGNKRIKVLVADDDPVSLHVLRGVLNNTGYEVIPAKCGLDALAVLRSDTPPRLAVLDWNMPDITGLEICRQVRESGNGQYTYIVLLTGRTGREDKAESLETGADDCLTKPFDVRELRARLQTGSRIIAEKEAQEALARSEALFRAITEHAADLIAVFDERYRFVYASPSYSSVLGYSAQELLAKNGYDLVHPDDREALERNRRQVLGGDKGETLTVQVQHKNESWRSIEVHMGGLLRGSLNGLLQIARDVTAQKQAQDELQSALQMKSDFISFATHQLRTPLAGIKWLLELAAQGSELGEETLSLVQDARDSAERLIGLVNDLLDVSRLESGRLKLHPEETTLGELTQGVLQLLGHQIDERGHQVSVSGESEAPPVRVDKQLFRQVILNLVSNAIKYTPPGGHIDIEMGPKDGFAYWAIHDSGVGIPDSAKGRLFEKFFRADNVQRMETEGTGLGLYIVRLVVERSGGYVWCESEEGQGTTFRWEIPAGDCRP
jgi:PAS domain S-box-containing protein